MSDNIDRIRLMGLVLGLARALEAQGDYAALVAALETAAGLPLAVDQGGTGATTQSAARTALGVDAAIASAIAAMVDSAPSTLDTLNELAAALGDDPNFATTMATALADKLPRKTAISTKTASYTAALADAETLVRMNVAGANNFTLPANADVAFAIGTRIDVQQIGAGQTTFVAASGVTIDVTKKKIGAQWGAASAIKTGTDTWTLIGALAT